VPLGVGARLGPYEILGAVASGGMGEVYRALDPRLGREVAVKVLAQEAPTDDRLRRFEQEARTTGALNHPNIMAVYDIGNYDGKPFVVSELLEGDTLRGVMARAAVAPGRAIDYAIQITRGLSAAHAKGIVHRDLKPDNLFVTRDGLLKILDFGLAKVARADRTKEGEAATDSVDPLTDPGTVLGTVGYMSPEQVRGLEVGPRSDLFSFGAVLFEMLAGRRPFVGPTPADVMTAILSQDPPPLSSISRQIPAALDRIVRRCLEKRAEDRFSSAHDVRLALEALSDSSFLGLPPQEEGSPYPGLAPFTTADAPHFFGREAEVEALWKKLRRLRLVGLIGPSGGGKTSFLNAGLLPALPEGWRAIVCQPGDAPLLNMGQALVVELSGDTDALRNLLRVEDPEVAFSILARWRRRHTQVLVVVDQFEELFTLNGPEVQARFASLLGRLAAQGDVHVLLSMRDDFLMHCHDHGALAPVFIELMPLTPPTGTGLRQAVVQPAIAGGYRFEDETLVDEMLAEVRAERGALPLLAFAMARLWERRDRERCMLTREAYCEIGGVAGALAQHAEATLGHIGGDRQGVVREILRNLVTPAGTRATRMWEELLSVFSPAERDAATQVLHALVDARLLTTFEVPAEEHEGVTRRVEIIHESLLKAWPRLVRWQTQETESAILRDQLRQAARIWDQRGRPEEMLWSGTAYREFRLWRERYPGRLTETEEAFGRAMDRQAGRKRRRRRLAFGAALLIASGIAVVTATLWRRAASEARRAEASKVLALGRLELDRYPTAALAYARKSLAIADTAEARLFVMETLWQGPPARILPATEMARAVDPELAKSFVGYFVLSPNGQWLATCTPDNKIALYSSDGGPPRALPRQPEPGAGGMVLAFSPRSDLLATMGSHGTMRFWSIPELREVRSVPLGGVETGTCWEHPWCRDLVTTTRMSKGATEEVVRGWTAEGVPRVLGTIDSREHGSDIDFGGTRVAFGQGRTVRVRRLDAPATASRVVGGMESRIWKVRFFPDGEHVAARDESGDLRIWALSDPGTDPEYILGKPKTRGSLSFAINGTGRRVAVGDEGLSIRLWDLEGPRPATPLLLRRQDTGPWDFAAFDPGDRWLAQSDGANLAFWPVTLPAVRQVAGTRDVFSMFFTADNEGLLGCEHGGQVHVWPLFGREGAPRTISAPGACSAVTTHGDDLLMGAMSPGKVLYWRSLSSEPRVLLERWHWDAAKKEAGGLPVAPVAIDAEGRRAAALPWDATMLTPEQVVLRVWDLASGEEHDYALAHVGDRVMWFPALAFEPDGDLLVAWPRRGVLRLVLPSDPSGTVAIEMVYAARRSTFALAADGRHVLIAASQKDGPENMLELDELLLLDRQTSAVHRITTHGARISALAMGRSGEVIVTGDARGVVRVGRATGEEPHLLVAGSLPVSAVSVSRDGRLIASASEDGIRLWPMPNLARPPFHTLPHDELVARLQVLTNLEAVEDPASPTGYSTRVGPFPGWNDVPGWW
jgi:WD40 repeat protein